MLAESTRRLSESLKERWPAIDWHAIAGFRNVAVHEYLGVDLEQVWRIVQRDVPALEGTVRAMLDDPAPTS